MHLGGCIEYQFADAPSREMINDSARVAWSPLDEAMVAS
jgi:hypothetical protein